jgi:ATP-dependent Clp protease ATP-binding subunit ClpC
MKTLDSQLNTFRPVVTYERNLGRKSLTALRIIFFIVFISCLFTIIGTTFVHGEYSDMLLGLTLIFFALWLEQILLYCYHNSFYFRGFDSVIASGNKDNVGISYECAQILLENENDVTASFIKSDIGLEALIRCGIQTSELETFIKSNRAFLPAQTIPLSTTHYTDVFDLGHYLYMYDENFKQFLEDQVVTQEVFIGSLKFVVKNYITQKRKKRWWSRDRLSLHRGIGRGLSTGVPYELERFSYELPAGDIARDQNFSTPGHLRIIQKIEQVLARSRAANILLIGNAGTGALDLLSAVDARVGKGSGLNGLAGLEFLVLDYKQLLSTFTEKLLLETELQQIFNQATTAGTIVIVIPDISHFIEEAKLLDIDLPNLLTVYLGSPTLHIIATDTASNYHHNLRPLDTFTHRFEEVLLEDTNVLDTISILEPIALRQESRRGVLFTYTALISIAENAERYLVDGVMPERAIDLIHEIAQNAAHAGVVVITNNFVDAFVANKTGMPIGTISETEKDRLLNLENILHTRVIGQEQAVNAIARTMRRARVDIERTDKPIGSFLFLGGTGVGKTETAKALAYTFFGAETNMVRLDMTEFSAKHTLGHLIGDENGTGILTDKLHDYPYCVLLLDEFEKADPAVHDLFLQILDEGYFTSTHGVRVNARNTIIIATSNAGSDLIRKTTLIRSKQRNLDADIISHIIEAGILKPELINRFDSTIIFEPLTQTDLEGVAKLLLQELRVRVLKEGYHLQVTPDLLTKLVERGYDPQSGGRGMTRVLQDVLEEKIAKKIINGEVKRGGNLHLDVSDFSKAELEVPK